MSSTPNDERLTKVQQMSQQLGEIIEAANGSLPYCELIALIFPNRRHHWYSSIWDTFKSYAERAIQQHPYLYASTYALWREVHEPDEHLMAAQGTIADARSETEMYLTFAGAMLAIEAWCQHSVVAPTQAAYTTVELAALDFWQCFGKDVLLGAFPRSASTVSASSLPIRPDLELGISNLHFNENAQQHALLSGQRLKYNRDRYAHTPHFSRIQAFGLHQDTSRLTNSGEPQMHAFFMPATQILNNMQRYFRSSTAFEEQRWRTVDSYNQYAQFSNIMLLNLCREVIRQITLMFRIQAAHDGGALLMPVDELLAPDLLATCHLPTVTEQILDHAEPRNWMPPVSINLQRFLSSGASASPVCVTPTRTAQRGTGVTTDVASAVSPVRAPEQPHSLTDATTAAVGNTVFINRNSATPTVSAAAKTRKRASPDNFAAAKSVQPTVQKRSRGKSTELVPKQVSAPNLVHRTVPLHAPAINAAAENCWPCPDACLNEQAQDGADFATDNASFVSLATEYSNTS